MQDPAGSEDAVEFGKCCVVFVFAVIFFVSFDGVAFAFGAKLRGWGGRDRRG